MKITLQGGGRTRTMTVMRRGGVATVTIHGDRDVIGHGDVVGAGDLVSAGNEHGAGGAHGAGDAVGAAAPQAAPDVTVQLEFRRGRGGRLVFLVDGRRMEAIGARGPDIGSRQLWLGGRLLAFRRESGAPGREAADDMGLAATIPAVVLEILVAPGAHVAEGDRLVLLESMKMVLPVTASQPGVVNAILCAEGDAVEPGVPLVDFTADPRADAD